MDEPHLYQISNRVRDPARASMTHVQLGPGSDPSLHLLATIAPGGMVYPVFRPDGVRSICGRALTGIHSALFEEESCNRIPDKRTKNIYKWVSYGSGVRRACMQSHGWWSMAVTHDRTISRAESQRDGRS